MIQSRMPNNVPSVDQAPGSATPTELTFWKGFGVLVFVVCILLAFGLFLSGLRSPAAPTASAPLSESEKLERGCQVIYLQTHDKKLSDLSMKEVDLIKFCRALDLYKEPR
jgi:hypothetical protein